MNRSTQRTPRALGEMASNSVWLLSGTVSRMIVAFVAAVWLTRYLGPERFGLYSYVIALVMIFAGISALGMNSLVTRELVEHPEDRDSILGSALGIRLIGGTIAGVVLVAVTFALHPEADYRMALVLFGTMLLIQPFDVTAMFYEAETRSRYVVAVRLIATVVYLGLLLAFMAADLDVLWFLGSRLAELALIQIGTLAVYAAQGHRPTKWRIETRRARSLVTEAWPLVLSAVGATLYLRIDQVMLGQMTDATEVGLYAAAARLSEIWYFIPGLIVASAFPYLLRLRKQDRTAYAGRLQQLYDVLFWLGLGIAIVVTAVAPFLVDVLYGDAYTASSTILRIHIWAGVFIFMRAAFSKWLIAERLLTFSLVTQGAGALVNIGANLFLIPRWGGTGAAWATVISYAVASYAALFLFKPTRSAATQMTNTIGAPWRYARIAIGARSDE